jgi:SRSO17 transposase
MRCSGCCTGRTGSGRGLRDARVLVVEQLGDPGAVLITDDTDFIKKAPVGRVQRQYFGTAGRTENGQAGHRGR